uniref:Uncharacterized protein n=1 Tax=Oryza punctata TaxID=4537 RepID=A0A0E0JFR9_ORYPU
MPSYSGGSMQFMSLGQSNNAIIGVDHECRTILYSTDWHAIRTMPSMHGCKWSPVSLAVNNMELYPRQDGHVSFEVLAYGSQHAYGSLPRNPSRTYPEDWYWCSLPMCTTKDMEKTRHRRATTSSSTTLTRSRRLRWSAAARASGYRRLASVLLPLTRRMIPGASGAIGLCRSVATLSTSPSTSLWFGLSSQGDDLFCASDIATASPPVVLDAWGLDHLGVTTSQECYHSKSYLVYLGNGRFCVGKLFHVEEGDTETERIVVLMGVEVEEPSDGDNRVLRMIKHRSKRYCLSANMTINLVVEKAIWFAGLPHATFFQEQEVIVNPEFAHEEEGAFCSTLSVSSLISH